MYPNRRAKPTRTAHNGTGTQWGRPAIIFNRVPVTFNAGIRQTRLPIRGTGLQRQSMQFAAHFRLQRFIDDLVLLNARLTAE